MEVIYYFVLFSTDGTLSSDEHVHLQKKIFQIDYEFRPLCTFFLILVQCVWLYPVTHQILPLYKATIEEISAEIFSVVLMQKKVYVYLHRPPAAAMQNLMSCLILHLSRGSGRRARGLSRFQIQMQHRKFQRL